MAAEEAADELVQRLGLLLARVDVGEGGALLLAEHALPLPHLGRNRIMTVVPLRYLAEIKPSLMRSQ